MLWQRALLCRLINTLNISSVRTELKWIKKKKLTYTFWQLWFQVSLLVFRWVWSSPMRMQCKWHHAMNMLIVRVLMHLSFIFQSYGTKFFRLAPSFGFCYFDFEYSFLTLWKKKKYYYYSDCLKNCLKWLWRQHWKNASLPSVSSWTTGLPMHWLF